MRAKNQQFTCNMPNPFDSIFELFGRRRAAINDGIHQRQFEELVELIKNPTGHLINLRAPRAGYGKTMLLSRLQESAKGSFLFVPVRLADGRSADPLIILEDLLTQLCEDLPGGGGLTRLDIITRQLFSKALAPMVYSGEVPCQDREGAYTSLRDRPVEAFDFHYEEAAIAQWCRQQFDILGPRLANELHSQSGAGNSESFFWVHQFFGYASQTPGQGNRLNSVMNAVFNDERHFRTKSNSQESLSALLNILGLVESVVLVLDEVEGLASDPDSALRAATFLSGLWEANPKLDVILSVNDDVWDSSFKARLPMGLRDRYEDTIIRLEELNEDEARKLITHRAGAMGEQIWSRMSQNKLEFYPRFLLKEARQHWNAIQNEKFARHQPTENQIPRAEFSNLSESRQYGDFQPAEEFVSIDPKPFESPLAKQAYKPANPAPFENPAPHATTQAPAPSPFAAEVSSSAQSNAAYPPYQTPFVVTPPPKLDQQENLQTRDSQAAHSNESNSFSPFAESAAELKSSPFQIDHASNSGSQLEREEKNTVDDLLRQFRERNGDI